MKIYLREITEQDTELNFSQDEDWVVNAVERVDEASDETPGLKLGKAAIQKAAARKPREIETHLSLRKVDDVVVVSGDVKTHIQLLCSRCATPFKLECEPRIEALFCKDPVMAGVAHLQGNKPSGQNHGYARHAHDTANDENMAEGKDLDITYLSEDFIDLGELLTEHLQLQVPFQPLCREDCKGMCPQCGADLNAGRCACAKLAKPNPFTALQDLKKDLKL